MKKCAALVVMIGILTGCGYSETEETTESKKAAETTAATELSTSEKKNELKEVDFQLEGTIYKIKILNNWQVQQEENNSFDASNEQEMTGIMAYGFKKTDIEGFDAFKSGMKEQTVSTEEFQIAEGTTQEIQYQTSHYAGELYSFIGKAEGVNMAVRYYFLETETDYVVINFMALPSFFDKNADLVTEILNSFVAA